MKSRGHVRGADHTEGDGVAEDVSGNLPARVENQILGNNHPVKVFQGKVGLDMKDNILTNIDGLGGAVNKDVMIFGSIGSPGNSFSNYLSVKFNHVKICNHFQLFYIFWHIKLKLIKFSSTVGTN